MSLRESLIDFNTQDQELNRFQANLKRYLRQFNEVPFLNGVVVEATIESTATAVPHKLGRKPVGWMVLDRRANARVWRTAWTDEFITLQGTAQVPVKLWVF